MRKLYISFQLYLIRLRKKQVFPKDIEFVGNILNAREDLRKLEELYRGAMSAAPDEMARNQCLKIIQICRRANNDIGELTDAISEFLIKKP